MKRPTPKEIMSWFTGMTLEEAKKVWFDCDNCSDNDVCGYAFDAYNAQGSGLARTDPLCMK